jgi:hypothetical protein
MCHSEGPGLLLAPARVRVTGHPDGDLGPSLGDIYPGDPVGEQGLVFDVFHRDSYDEGVVEGRGRARERWAIGNLVRGLEAPLSGPGKSAPSVQTVIRGRARQAETTSAGGHVPILATTAITAQPVRHQLDTAPAAERGSGPRLRRRVTVANFHADAASPRAPTTVMRSIWLSVTILTRRHRRQSRSSSREYTYYRHVAVR